MTQAGSPWADAKALTITAPAVLLTAAFGAAALESRGLRIPALVAAGLIGLGVLASNAAIYHDVSLAPADRLTELGDLGERAAGRGPLLYTEFEEFAKYYLRDADPVGATEAFVVPGLSPTVAGGSRPAFGVEADVSELQVPDVQRFGAIVLRRSPTGARPPAEFRRASTTRFYELWVKDEDAPTTVAQESMDGDAGQEDCGRLRGLAAAVPGADGTLRAATAPPTVELVTADEDLPKAWSKLKSDPDLVQTLGPGSVSADVQVPRGGLHEVWLRGSFGREVDVLVDGETVGSAASELAYPAGWVELGDVLLQPGPHRLTLQRGQATLAPGSGDGRRMLGSLVLRRKQPAARSVVVPAARWQRLCRLHLLSATAVVPAS